MTARDARKLFTRELRLFRRYFPSLTAKLVIHKVDGDKFRDLAWADRNNWTVTIRQRLLEYSDNTIIGMIRHELGHLSDPFILSKNCEQRADDIAELVTGTRISYSGPHKLQTIGDGEYPRPLDLHR